MNKQEQIAKKWIEENIGKVIEESDTSDGLDFMTQNARVFEVKSIGKSNGQIQDKIPFKIGQLMKMGTLNVCDIIVVDRIKEEVIMTFQITNVKKIN